MGGFVTTRKQHMVAVPQMCELSCLDISSKAVYSSKGYADQAYIMQMLHMAAVVPYLCTAQWQEC